MPRYLPAAIEWCSSISRCVEYDGHIVISKDDSHSLDLACSSPIVLFQVLYSLICTSTQPSTSNAPLSIAPLPTLRHPQLIHLRNPLLELHILALLIGMSLVLSSTLSALIPILPSSTNTSSNPPLSPLAQETTHLALPRQIISLITTPIQRDK